MKTLYFDLIGGISGDMTVAALLDLGLSFDFLKRELKKLKLSGYVLKKAKVSRGHIQAVKFDCIVKKNIVRSYQEITRLIKTSRLSAGIKANILKVYEVLAVAETKVHGHKHSNIHFEQLGEIDSIIDIASVCIGLDYFNVDSIQYSFIPIGNDIAPATFELLIGKEVYFTGEFAENMTPTGAAILCALGKQSVFPGIEPFVFKNCGYGAGLKDSAYRSNVLRIAEVINRKAGLERDAIMVAEANIDDMNPQFFEEVFEKLFDAGALDVYLSNVIMKKSRPGFLLTVLSNKHILDKIAEIMLKETTTNGVRFYPVERVKLPRQIKIVLFNGQKAAVKVVTVPGLGFRFAPEYDDCKKIAKIMHEPISKIYDKVKQLAEKSVNGN